MEKFKVLIVVNVWNAKWGGISRESLEIDGDLRTLQRLDFGASAGVLVNAAIASAFATVNKDSPIKNLIQASREVAELIENTKGQGG